MLPCSAQAVPVTPSAPAAPSTHLQLASGASYSAAPIYTQTAAAGHMYMVVQAKCSAYLQGICHMDCSVHQHASHQPPGMSSPSQPVHVAETGLILQLHALSCGSCQHALPKLAGHVLYQPHHSISPCRSTHCATDARIMCTTIKRLLLPRNTHNRISCRAHTIQSTCCATCVVATHQPPHNCTSC